MEDQNSEKMTCSECDYYRLIECVKYQKRRKWRWIMHFIGGSLLCSYWIFLFIFGSWIVFEILAGTL